MNDKKAPRHAPIVTGFFWLTISILLLFWHPEGILYYAKILLGGGMMFFGLHSLKIGFFASDEEINLRVAGLSDKEIRNRLNKTESPK
jgi:hypothetical protein